MNTNDIDSWTIDRRIGKVLNPSRFLSTRDTSSDDSNVAFTEPDRVFEVRCYLAEPCFSSNNGPDSRPGFILHIYTLFDVSISTGSWTDGIPE